MRLARATVSAACLTLLAVAPAAAARVNVTLKVDTDDLAGADDEGRVLLYTPKELAERSSLAHFDPEAVPNLLMEPAISRDLEAGEVDITRAALEDIGWRRGELAANISYADADGTGFSDPVLGDSRRAALEFAVARWQSLLGSPVTVDIEARFDGFDCDETGGVLGAAGPNFAFMDVPGGLAGVWYTGPLAEALSGRDLSDGSNSGADLDIVFNREVDNGCLGAGTRFYYGTDDGAAPNEISFVNVAMHELAHGLGFVPLADRGSGELFMDAPDAFSRLALDRELGMHWDELSNAQRRRAATSPGRVVYDGPLTTAAADGLLTGTDVLVVNRPRKLRGVYEIGRAVFGPQLADGRVRGDLALVDDGSSRPTLGCEPLINGDEVAGKVALIDRGECLFTIKVKNAQDAGALAAVIIHNEGGPPPLLGGSDPTITIPSVRIGRRDGRKLKRRVER